MGPMRKAVLLFSLVNIEPPHPIHVQLPVNTMASPSHTPRTSPALLLHERGAPLPHARPLR
ncbi:hypothetical protein K466DRAFT_590423 [Polyporus arcularius HHB13444]|uniref:Uncharacterized protein n=1 Tax=Polyporus arcularius HHB13444 TaxID=1314778 RepID=A0A5C3NYQ0_9APHY|nr:hypothetical protein K466DRAFT_590423 [Polyporus arcularius HHB13444]